MPSRQVVIKRRLRSQTLGVGGRINRSQAALFLRVVNDGYVETLDGTGRVSMDATRYAAHREMQAEFKKIAVELRVQSSNDANLENDGLQWFTVRRVLLFMACRDIRILDEPAELTALRQDLATTVHRIVQDGFVNAGWYRCLAECPCGRFFITDHDQHKYCRPACRPKSHER